MIARIVRQRARADVLKVFDLLASYKNFPQFDFSLKIIHDDYVLYYYLFKNFNK